MVGEEISDDVGSNEQERGIGQEVSEQQRER